MRETENTGWAKEVQKKDNRKACSVEAGVEKRQMQLQPKELERRLNSGHMLEAVRYF